MSTHDVVVVGAGIVGAACARALARDGRRVLVLDEGVCGGGTTAAGMGHVVVMDDSPEQLALTALSAALWRELRPTLPAFVEYDACGTIWVAADEAQLAAVREKRALYAAHGVAADELDARDLIRLEPELRPDLVGGLLVRDDAVIYPPNAARALLDEAQAAGATVREGCRVDAIGEHAVRCGAEVLRAEVVVNAAGVAAQRLTPELPIVPRKGHLVITDRAPGFVRHQLVELGYLASAHTMTTESVAFNVQPRVTGQVLVGSSRQLVGHDASLDRGLLRRMLERAAHFLPRLADLSVVRAWTGFRPATPDKLPLVGAWTPTPGLWIAAGHEGLGIATSLGTARLLADLIAGREPPLDAAPFSPLRALTPAGVS